MTLELNNIDKLNDCQMATKEIPVVKLYGAQYQSYVFNGGDDMDFHGGDDFAADGSKGCNERREPLPYHYKKTSGACGYSGADGSNSDKSDVKILGMHPVTFGLALVGAGIATAMAILIVKNIKA